MNHLLLYTSCQYQLMTIILYAAFILPSFSFAQSTPFTLATNRVDNTFKVNEQMYFEVESNVNDNVSYTIRYDKYAPILKRGSIAIRAGKKTRIPFTASIPSSVVCEVSNSNHQEREGILVEPFSIFPSEAPPPDFETFWQDNLYQLAAITIDPQLSFLEETAYSKTYRINLATVDERRVYGYISIPKQSGKLPAILSLPPFGAGANIVKPASTLAEQVGAISMIISIHNAEPDEKDPNAYLPDNITNRDEYYQKYSVLAAIRAIDYLHTRADFNGSLALNGVSQGGGLTLMAAGLDKRVDVIAFVNPTYNDHAGFNHNKASGFPYYLGRANQSFQNERTIEQTAKASKYYDATYLAKNFSGPTLAIIGYEDLVCPASTSLAAFNNIKGVKILHHGADLDHRNPSEYWIGRYDFYRRFLNGANRAPWPYAQSTKGYFIDAGIDHTIRLDSTLQLSGLALYNEETLSSRITWTQVDGTGTAIFQDESTIATNVNFTEPGEYLLELRIKDERSLSDQKFYTLIDQVKITVEASDNDDEEEQDPLEFECPKDIQISTNSTSAIVNWETPKVANACEGTPAVVQQIKGPERGTSFPVGTTLIEYSVTDACGRSAFCSFQVEVTQALIPLEIVCPNNIAVTTSSTAEFVTWELPEVFNACSEKIEFILIEGKLPGSVFPEGITDITYEVRDECGRMEICSFQVEVIQASSPLEIKCPQDITLSTFTESAKVTWELPRISNACSENISLTLIDGLPSGSYFLTGITDVTYEVTDDCGNIATCSFQVEVIQQKLEFQVQCPQDTMIYLPPGQLTIPISWDAPMVTTDCHYGLTVRQVKGPLSGNIFTVGITEIIYEIEDECGNSATCSFNIKVNFSSIGNLGEGEQRFTTIIYPNPADQMLTIESIKQPAEAVPYIIEITNKLGQVVIQKVGKHTTSEMINIADLANGWYSWRIKTEEVIVEVGSFIKLSK